MSQLVGDKDSGRGSDGYTLNTQEAYAISRVASTDHPPHPFPLANLQASPPSAPALYISATQVKELQDTVAQSRFEDELRHEVGEMRQMMHQLATNVHPQLCTHDVEVCDLGWQHNTAPQNSAVTYSSFQTKSQSVQRVIKTTTTMPVNMSQAPPRHLPGISLSLAPGECSKGASENALARRSVCWAHPSYIYVRSAESV